MQNTSDAKDLDKYLSIGEASEYLGVSIDTLRRWEKRGRLTTFRSPGGHRYFKKQNLDTLFGTKYQRDENEKITAQVGKNAPIKTTDKISPTESETESSDPAIEKPQPISEIQQPTVAKEYFKDKLNVPRFIKTRAVSKYDILLTIPNLAIQEDNVSDSSAFAENRERKLGDEGEEFSASADFAPTKRAETPSAKAFGVGPKIPLASAGGASFEPPEDSQSILIPKDQTPTSGTHESQNAQDVKTHPLSTFFNIKNVVFLGFVLFIIVDLILFIVILSKPQVLSPIP